MLRAAMSRCTVVGLDRIMTSKLGLYIIRVHKYRYFPFQTNPHTQVSTSHRQSKRQQITQRALPHANAQYLSHNRQHHRTQSNDKTQTKRGARCVPRAEPSVISRRSSLVIARPSVDDRYLSNALRRPTRRLATCNLFIYLSVWFSSIVPIVRKLGDDRQRLLAHAKQRNHIAVRPAQPTRFTIVVTRMFRCCFSSART